MGIIEDVFQMERKKCKDQKNIKSMPERGRFFSMGKKVFFEAVEKETLEAAARNSAGKKGEQKKE